MQPQNFQLHTIYVEIRLLYLWLVYLLQFFKTEESVRKFCMVYRLNLLRLKKWEKLGEQSEEPSVQFRDQCGAVSKIDYRSNAVICTKNS